MEKTFVLLSRDRNDADASGRPITRRRWPLSAVAGDRARYPAVELELIPDAIRELIDRNRVFARKRAAR